ncbi:MAG: ribosome-associated translation inhibitor RaiA [Parvibaculum sp.]|jgi:ribosomal subunit interface protein|uniref:ribosome hibernation-promoting factor, HPF/YfiA family n=1 Tax=Parvibaculum sp. TaxID=2024848 RepID=UPI002842BACE|nr:ribosome-associated translation inhibitor RaiA [Parvibaculum sp.]MDR3499805.1 ribosome-associated translation inhibitor RaiA [Parvibaculum sp.]
MQVQVSGHHLDIGDALRTHVLERLEASVSKYFDNPVDGHVTFSKDGHEFRADCAVHLNSGMHINTQGRAGDPYASFDDAVEKLEKRLRRYKRRLKSHSNNHKAGLPAESFPSFVIEAGDEHEEAPEDGQPVIIAEGTTSVARLSVGDAVMQMDLNDSSFVVFRNGATGGLNVVYRREDGHIGWIDASLDPKA